MNYCSQCGNKTKENEKFCHNCGSNLQEINNTINEVPEFNNVKSNKWESKTTTKVFIIVFIVLCVIISFALSDKTENVDSHSNSNKYIALDVQCLYNDYSNNEIAAKEKYSNNNYYFTGTIYDIKHFLTDNYIKIRYESKADKYKTIEITAYFDDEEELLNIKKGDKVTIYGEFYQRSFENYKGVLTSFSFKHCTFNKNN